jgi:hypothetical protein
VKRFGSLIFVTSAVAACAVPLAGGVTAASAASPLPTLNLALTGTKGVSVSGSQVSGAVNVVSTFTGKGQGDVGLVRLNPALPPAQALAQGLQAVQTHGGDLNALTPLGDAFVFDASAPSTTQTVLTPGTWAAFNLTGQGNNPPFVTFTVSQSSSPAGLPQPAATVKAIEFGFKGPKTLREGELVRFENDGFLVHMITGIRVKNTAIGAAEIAALKAGNQRLAQRLASGFANFMGPVSPGGMQQERITAKPGVYVLACFMDTQDHREHIQLGMERMIRIVK